MLKDNVLPLDSAKPPFVRSVLDSLWREHDFEGLLMLAQGKCEANASAIDLVFPLITRQLTFNFPLMLGLNDDYRRVSAALRAAQAKLAGLEDWSVGHISQGLHEAADHVGVPGDAALRWFKYCILFKDSPLDLVPCIRYLGAAEAGRRLISAADAIDAAHMVG